MMTRSAFALLALAALVSALAGCSGTRPFWQADPAADRAAERSVEGPLTLARLAEQRGKHIEAERLYRSILERSPNNPVVHHRLAIMQSRNGRFEEANTYFDRALQLKPDDPTLLCDAGYCQYLQHRLDLAETLFRDALAIDPRHEAATNNLALVLAEKGEDQAAFALFRETGTEARAHANMGFVYSRRGDLEKAKAAYNRALSIDPQMIVAAEALVQLAQFERQSRAMVAQSRASRAAWDEYDARDETQARVKMQVRAEAQVQFVEPEPAASPEWESAQPAAWQGEAVAAPEPAAVWHTDAPPAREPEPHSGQFGWWQDDAEPATGAALQRAPLPAPMPEALDAPTAGYGAYEPAWASDAAGY